MKLEKCACVGEAKRESICGCEYLRVCQKCGLTTLEDNWNERQKAIRMVEEWRGRKGTLGTQILIEETELKALLGLLKNETPPAEAGKG